MTGRTGLTNVTIGGRLTTTTGGRKAGRTTTAGRTIGLTTIAGCTNTAGLTNGWKGTAVRTITWALVLKETTLSSMPVTSTGKNIFFIKSILMFSNTNLTIAKE